MLYRIVAVTDTIVGVINDGLELLHMNIIGQSLISYNLITCKIIGVLQFWFRALTILVVLRLIPWIQDLFSYFLDPCLLEILRNEWIDIHDISGYGHEQRLAGLFHTWLDCFTLLKLGAAEVCAFGVLLVLHEFVLQTADHYPHHLIYRTSQSKSKSKKILFIVGTL